MNTSSFKNRAARVGLAALLAVGVAATASATASADTAPPPGEVTTNSSAVVLLPGHTTTIPTWIFGKTHVCATNLGTGPGVLKVKAQLFWALPEYIHVTKPFERACIDRYWGGVPVDLTNESVASPLLVEAS
ncbi:hypothetical protein LFM09_17820 [Lentzea alba]|uniref:hypothetical protein n=1 Tax=Lentzea alba TaxID=2714351 RepID=UPI0039BF924F